MVCNCLKNIKTARAIFVGLYSIYCIVDNCIVLLDCTLYALGALCGERRSKTVINILTVF